jgi:hypothetical protein
LYAQVHITRNIPFFLTFIFIIYSHQLKTHFEYNTTNFIAKTFLAITTHSSLQTRQPRLS